MGAKVILGRFEPAPAYLTLLVWGWGELERNFEDGLDEQESKELVRGPALLLPASSHSTPRFPVFRERRVGWGGVGWRTTGSGAGRPGAVGDPGMLLGFRVRAGQKWGTEPGPCDPAHASAVAGAVPRLTPPFPAGTRIPHPRPPNSTLALTWLVGGGGHSWLAAG